MSIESLRSVLRDYRDRVEDSLETELPLAQRQSEEARLERVTHAEAELDDIVIAALVLHRCAIGVPADGIALPAIDRARDTMTSIAKESM